jgi:hypothetical protein
MAPAAGGRDGRRWCACFTIIISDRRAREPRITNRGTKTMIIHTYQWQADGEEPQVMAFRTMRQLERFRTKQRAKSTNLYFNCNEIVKTHDVKPTKQGVIDFFNWES